MEDGLELLSSAEAAKLLNVGVQTLYAYVSRGKISSVSQPGQKAKLYRRADVERLAANKVAVSHLSSNSLLVPETKITLVTPTGMFYRGKNTFELAEKSNFEDVALLLWGAGEASDVFKDPVVLPQEFAQLWEMSLRLPLVERALVLFPFIERSNPRGYGLRPGDFAHAGAEILRVFASIICENQEVCHEPIDQYVVRSMAVKQNYQPMVRMLLTVVADHQLDPSTYAVRSVSNAGVTPYQAVMAGLVSSRGRRGSFGKWEASIGELIQKILSGESAQDIIVEKYRNGDALAGFRSGKIGPDGPRTQFMAKFLARELEGDQEFKRLAEAIDFARELTGQHATAAFYASFIGYKVGFKGNALSLSLLGRIAGWIAHASEQYNEQEFVRMSVSYTGERPTGTLG